MWRKFTKLRQFPESKRNVAAEARAAAAASRRQQQQE